MSKGFRLFTWLFLGMLVVDQLVKFWVRATMAPGQSLNGPIPGFFEITLTYNTGVAFGMLQGLGVYLTPIAVIIAALAGLYSFKNPKESLWMHTSLGLIASGALGNLYDRAIRGQVTDMFSLVAIHFPVFNVADSCITVGVTIMVLHGIVSAFREQRQVADPPEEVPER